MNLKRLIQILRSPAVVASAKVAVFAVVACFIWRAVTDAQQQMAAEQFDLASVDVGWLLIAAIAFLIAQLPMAWFWWQAMRHLGQRPGFWRTLSAYYIGGLGKYVPGKAMVVVLRAGLVRGPGVDTTVAALCVFIETLTMMAVGGFLGAVLVLFTGSPVGQAWVIYPLAIGLMLATGVPTLPPVFRFVVKMLRVSKASANIDQILQQLDYQLMAQGWIANLIAWPIMGLSLWATLRAMPGTEAALRSPVEQLPLLTAAIALAVVAGFASMLPGGVGVRELVLNVLMTPTFGQLAIVSIILLRFVWLLAELAISSILYAWGKATAKKLPAEADSAAENT